MPATAVNGIGGKRPRDECEPLSVSSDHSLTTVTTFITDLSVPSEPSDDETTQTSLCSGLKNEKLESIGSLTYTSPEVLHRFGLVDGRRSAIPRHSGINAKPSPSLGGGHVHTIVPSTVTKSGLAVLKTLTLLSQMPAKEDTPNDGVDGGEAKPPTNTVVSEGFLDHVPAHSVLREIVLSAYDGSRLIMDWRFAESSIRGGFPRRKETAPSPDTDVCPTDEKAKQDKETPVIEVLVGASGVLEGDLNSHDSLVDDFSPPQSWTTQLGVVPITFPLKKVPTTVDHPQRRIPIKRGVFLLLPGLSSSIESGYIQTLVMHASSPLIGFDVVIANARGLGQVDTFLDAPNMFCAAFTDDTKHVLLNEISHESLSRRGFYYAGPGATPQSTIPVVVAGFSFGGIILSRALGEIGQRNPIRAATQISPLLLRFKPRTNDNGACDNQPLLDHALEIHGSRSRRILGPDEKMNIVAAATVCSPLDMEATNHYYTSNRINYLLYRSPLVEGLIDYIRRHAHVFLTSSHAALRQVAALAIERETKRSPAKGEVSTTLFEEYTRLKRKQGLAALTANERKVTSEQANFDKIPASVWELEKCVIAPVFGFEDHIDYYRKSAPIIPGHLDGVANIATAYANTTIPVLCLLAEDDPIVGPGLNLKQQAALCNRWWSHRSSMRDHGEGGICVYKCSSGGHLGFLKGAFVERKDFSRLNKLATIQDQLSQSAARSTISRAQLDATHQVVYSGCGWCANFMEEFVVAAMKNALKTIPETVA